MANCAKLLAKASSSPKNLRFEDLCALAVLWLGISKTIRFTPYLFPPRFRKQRWVNDELPATGRESQSNTGEATARCNRGFE